MTAKRIISLSVAWLLFTGLVTAQPPGSGTTPPSMSEDIEIMRHLLLHKVMAAELKAGMKSQRYRGLYFNSQPGYELYHSPEGVPTGAGLVRNYLDTDLMAATVGKGGVVQGEGLYIKGQGVVFALTMPPVSNPQASAGTSPGKTLSDWERVRQQLRGDKKEAPTDEPAHPSLADILLAVLAENGKHFTRLGDNESLTVAVTFRDVDRSQGTAGMGGSMTGGGAMGMGEGSGGASGGFGEGGVGAPPGGGSGLPGASGPGAGGSSSGGGSPGFGTGGEGLAANPSTAKDYELLGDLHFRQGNMDQAVNAYEEGVKRTSKSKELAALYQKLASAHLASQRKDHSAAIQRGLDWLAKAQEELKKSARQPDNETPATSVPSRLTITAPKKVLDQVGSGKMSLEEFKKAVTVDYQTPSASPKKGSN